MKRLTKNSMKKRFTLMAGIIIAFTILFTQAYSYQFSEESTGISINSDEDNNEAAAYYLSQNAVSVSSIQLNISKPFQVVFEFFLSEDEGSETEPVSIPLIQDFLKTLFRITISPNAP